MTKALWCNEVKSTHSKFQNWMDVSGHLRKRAPSIDWTGQWVGPKEGMDVMVKRNILAPARN
jgi:hypothetical protein